MNLKLSLVREQFDSLISGTASRERVSDWARSIREADDRDEVQLSSDEDGDRIWKAVLFLEGVDLKDSPETYLHNEADIQRERP